MYTVNLVYKMKSGLIVKSLNIESTVTTTQVPCCYVVKKVNGLQQLFAGNLIH